MNQKDGDNSEWENMESLERREPISLLEIWKNLILTPSAQRGARKSEFTEGGEKGTEAHGQRQGR